MSLHGYIFNYELAYMKVGRVLGGVPNVVAFLAP